VRGEGAKKSRSAKSRCDDKWPGGEVDVDGGEELGYKRSVVSDLQQAACRKRKGLTMMGKKSAPGSRFQRWVDSVQRIRKGTRRKARLLEKGSGGLRQSWEVRKGSSPSKGSKARDRDDKEVARKKSWLRSKYDKRERETEDNEYEYVSLKGGAGYSKSKPFARITGWRRVKRST